MRSTRTSIFVITKPAELMNVSKCVVNSKSAESNSIVKKWDISTEIDVIVDYSGNASRYQKRFRLPLYACPITLSHQRLHTRLCRISQKGGA